MHGWCCNWGARPPFVSESFEQAWLAKGALHGDTRPTRVVESSPVTGRSGQTCLSRAAHLKRIIHSERAASDHLIFDANLIVSPATMNVPYPRWCKVRGALLDASIQALTTSSTRKL